MHFKSAVPALCLLFMLSAWGFAQNDSTTVAKNSLEKGAKALQFGVSRNFTLSNFDGSDISFKHQFSNKSALRMGLGFLLDLDSDTDDRTDSNPSVYSSQRESSTKLYGVSINAAWLKHLSPSKRISFYWGGGPIVGFDRIDTNVAETVVLSDSTSTFIDREQGQMVWEFGGILIFGTEYFLSKEISLTAEYRSTNSFFRTKDELSQIRLQPGSSTETRVSKGTANRFRAGVNNVLFGLSAFF